MRGDATRVTDRLKAAVQRDIRAAIHRRGLGVAANAAVNEIVLTHDPPPIAAEKAMGCHYFRRFFATIHSWVK